jgi:tRNA threonylcarbamoyladenosine biosynthesis protein TsaB
VTTILCIDTASQAFALALRCDGDVRSLTCEYPQDHTRRLLTAIRELTGGHPVDAIAVVTGPGSYAGLRVGIATAQGMALALGLPIQGIATLDAAAAASGSDPVTAIHPAGRGEFAVCEYRGSLAAGRLHSAPADQLPREPVLAGDGAGLLGGIEVSPEERCRAALQLATSRGFERDTEVDALYLREPNITLPRRRATATA